MAVLLRSAPAVLLSLTLLLTAAAGYPDVQSRPLVATREGIVRGVARRSAAGGLFFGFKGIPYARAPLGPLRFQPPQRHPGWADVLDGLKHGRTCLQYNAFKNNSLEGDEDCLFANVNAKQAAYPADSPTYTMIRFMSQRHMRLNAEPSVGERLFEERVRIWQSVRMNEAWRHERPATPTCSPARSSPRERASSGAWRGASAAGGLFFGFKGIPYARAPLGPLRFQPPQRHPGWADVLDGLKHGRTCLQYNAFKNNSLEGDEDCLFANVYTPQLPALERAVGGLPVMVFIHGGGFTMGSGDEEVYGPNYFMDEAVVLVTFNYRLGPFGFFTAHDKNAPGNYGLLDQVMLLQWVRDNIARFGGDPATVTVFGESAGGASVSLLVLSPLAKGLFHHAISQSGTAFANFAAGGKAKDFTQKFAEQLSCSVDDVSIMVECIRNAPSEHLMEAKKN
ncbi:acetylcholinesterase-like [Pollicipes pollicipes]|uniref:acetylcholinesterase-like n=1 Tax=Pollicipes pollicipes TaxID=41117 RepID=UPI0018852C7A|nr:acetylcholinesterase-like [Pollicipes pollicipes]